ncbi:hypothetical protein MA16_Dca026155 [Dendrobium catenatum]|uniref:Uncharacterized protein n=1 Tax=Dendrobium catenatum TaxID=906689 RepID=A0A2I0WID9_9ASPA|nr:hypothetical protein MA16_Dca026155 [Dendrobium catenatum]
MELDLMGLLERSAPAPTSMESPPVVEDDGVDVRLELSLGLSSGEGESRKRARESDEAVIEKKPKMEEGSVPSVLQVMPAIFPRPISCCYSCMISDWLPISMEDVGNNVYEPRAKLSFTLETNEAAACDLQAEVVGESSSPESQKSGTSVLQLFC